MRAMALSLALGNRQAHLKFALIDPKRRGFGPLSSLPHLIAPPAQDANAALALLERLNREMDRRDAGMHLIVGAQKPSSSLPGAHLKANLPVRLVEWVGSVEDARGVGCFGFGRREAGRARRFCCGGRRANHTLSSGA